MVAATCLVAATYGLVRLAYGLFLPDITASLALGTRTAGRVSSGASVAYCVGALCGLTAQRHARLLVLAALVTASLGSLGMALAPDAALFVPAAVLSSAGAGLASPALVVVVERTVRAARRDRTQAVVNSGTGPGLVAAGVLALALVPDWRLGFVLSALVTTGAGLAVLLLDRAPAAPLPRREAHAAEPPMKPRTWRPLLVPATAAWLLGAASAVVWTYGRSHLVAEGVGGPWSTLAWICLGLGGTLSVVTAGLLGGLHPARSWLVTTTGVVVAVATIGAGAGHLPVALAGCALFGWAFVAATSALIAWAGLQVPERVAAATSILFVLLVLGQAAGSSAAGTVAERHGLASAFALAVVVAVLAAACGLRRPHPVRAPRPAEVTAPGAR